MYSRSELWVYFCRHIAGIIMHRSILVRHTALPTDIRVQYLWYVLTEETYSGRMPVIQNLNGIYIFDGGSQKDSLSETFSIVNFIRRLDNKVSGLRLIRLFTFYIN